MALEKRNCPQDGGDEPREVTMHSGSWLCPLGSGSVTRNVTSQGSPGSCAAAPAALPSLALGCAGAVSLCCWRGTARGMLWKCQVTLGTPGDTEAGGVSQCPSHGVRQGTGICSLCARPACEGWDNVSSSKSRAHCGAGQCPQGLPPAFAWHWHGCGSAKAVLWAWHGTLAWTQP